MDNRDNYRISRERHPMDDPLKSSIKEIEAFKESFVWKDMADWIEERKDYLSGQLRKADSMKEVRGIQQALDQLDDILDLPDMFIEQLEAEKDITPNENVEV